MAQRIAGSRHLRFGGLQAYHGSAQHKRTIEERRKLIEGAVDASRRTVEQLRQQGLDCAIVGGAGTGTFGLEAASGVYNEIQAGSYVFMDADYGRNMDEAGQPFGTFRHSLFVLASVMSVPTRSIAVVDAGLKALAVDSGLPTLWQRPDIRYVGASDEHGKMEVGSETAMPKLGEKLRLVPGHCDPTVDRYDWYVGVRNGRVECLWPVAAGERCTDGVHISDAAAADRRDAGMGQATGRRIAFGARGGGGRRADRGAGNCVGGGCLRRTGAEPAGEGGPAALAAIAAGRSTGRLLL